MKAKRNTKFGVLATILALACAFVMMPSVKSEASTVTVNGGYTTRATAYNWGTYSQYNTITGILPEEEDDFWVQVSVPGNSRIYARCSYDTSYDGMFLTMRNSNGGLLDICTSDDAYGLDTVTPFLAVNCDNTTSSARTFYIHVSRGTHTGTMYFSLSMNNRIKTGHATFSFSGTASNTGNTSMSLSGVDSSELTLNLTNNTTIPPHAIVTSVSTSGTQSPSQGNVHHMIRIDGTWYTSTYASATSGNYNIDTNDNIEAKQQWRFKYNALATAKSTMKNVKLTLNWEYDISLTEYTAY